MDAGSTRGRDAAPALQRSRPSKEMGGRGETEPAQAGPPCDKPGEAELYFVSHKRSGCKALEAGLSHTSHSSQIQGEKCRLSPEATGRLEAGGGRAAPRGDHPGSLCRGLCRTGAGKGWLEAEGAGQEEAAFQG